MNRSARFARRAVAVLALGAIFTLAPAVTSSAVAHEDNRTFVTVLTGANEVPPGVGDPDGIGVAIVTVQPSQGRICYLLAVHRLDGTVTAAHIHQAPVGVNGPVVVPLAAPVGGVSADCTTVAPALATDIVRNPANYYVNVHTTVFPGGAVRGQLR